MMFEYFSEARRLGRQLRRDAQWMVPCDACGKLADAVYPKYKINPSNFSHIKCNIQKNNGSTSKRFRKQLVQIISQPNIPEFKNKNEIVKWVSENILEEINKSQSVCKFSLVRFAEPENTLELRKLTA